MENIILLTDSYKVTHWPQYPPGTKFVYSYFESRGGKFNETLFFELQSLIKKYLEGPVVTLTKIKEAKKIYDVHLGPGMFNEAGWLHILHKHGGRLPLKIKAVPEGSIIPTSNVLVTVENTDPECYWLTNYVESLLVQLWYPITVATLSYECKKIIKKFLQDTGTPELIDFKLHDFGFRTVSSVESAGIGGAAHLINFKGTDNIPALSFVQNYYNSEVCGFSIPAAEHSTITSWGKENEGKAFENMLQQYPNGFVAVVSDSYDIYNAVANIWGGELWVDVNKRAGKGTLVIRPDSGDPKEVILRILEILESKFGVTYNEKNYKVLPDHIRIIQGDGVNYESIREILLEMRMNKWSADNIAFGMGGALLQTDINRDTQKFAFKCSSININGEERPVFKQPVTDSGKTSKKGRLSLIKIANSYTTINEYEAEGDLLETVFYNGELTREVNFEEIVKRANG